MAKPKLLQERPLYDKGLDVIRNAHSGITIKDLAMGMGVTERVVRDYIDRWIANREIYIHDWVRNAKFYLIPTYRVQNARKTLQNKPKPPRLTHAEKNKRAKRNPRGGTVVPPPSDNIILSTLMPTVKGVRNGKRA